MSAHTPGPWRIEGYSRRVDGEVMGHTISHGFNSYGDGPGGYVCTTSGTSKADARLIAAAPDLLEALKVLHARYLLIIGNEGPEALQARAAIAKATGEAK